MRFAKVSGPGRGTEIIVARYELKEIAPFHREPRIEPVKHRFATVIHDGFCSAASHGGIGPNVPRRHVRFARPALRRPVVLSARIEGLRHGSLLRVSMSGGRP